MVLNEAQLKEIKLEISAMNNIVNNYINCEDKINELESKLKNVKDEYSKLTEEEKIIDAVMDVVYNQEKKLSISKQKEDEMDSILSEISSLKNDCSKVKTSIIFKMKEFPFPINIDDVKYQGSDALFSYYDELRLNENMFKIMINIIEQDYPLSINDVIFYDDKVVVKNKHDRKLAIEKIVDSVRNYRLYVDNISKSYERIDGMLERVSQSTNYEGIILSLYKYKTLSADKIGAILNIDRRKAYDSCYNLTRDNWSPSPIKKINGSNYGITITGKILVERLFEKYPKKYKNFIEDIEVSNNGYS